MATQLDQDYAEMLLAAGWIQASDLDEEYQEHVRCYGAIDYDNWQSMRAEWDRLDARYKSEIEPHYHNEDVPVPYRIQEAGERLLRQMTNIEAALGY